MKHMHDGCKAAFRGRHVQDDGYGSEVGYGTLQPRGTDGTGTIHMSVMVRCKNCGKSYQLVRFHIPSRERVIVDLMAAKQENERLLRQIADMKATARRLADEALCM